MELEAPLERSNAAYHVHNLRGLPEDVFCLIAANLTFSDIARAAQVRRRDDFVFVCALPCS